MPKPEKRKLERVHYWQGQMLRSRDFRDIEAGDAQRRWWHNRALHNAYGVAEGLDCSLPVSARPTGVLVTPGVAYDIFGRELVLEQPQLIPLPIVPPSLTATISLVMRYKPPSHVLRPDESSELCWSAGGCIAAGTAEFVWQQGINVNPAEGVAVCRVDYDKGKAQEPKFQLRASTRPQALPLLASGTTIPGNTPWSPWSAGFTFDANQNQIPFLIGVQTWIDTSAAGFTQVPCYFAWLQGALWNPQTRQLTPAIFPSITDESVHGFTFRLWLQAIRPPIGAIDELLNPERGIVAAAAAAPSFFFVSDPEEFSLFARQQQLYVSWIGCQMQAQASCCDQKSAATAAPTRSMTSSRNT
jgi:hypothetical protein